MSIRYIYEITENAEDIDDISADILIEQGNALEADAFKDMEGVQGNELRIAFIARFAALGCSSPDLLHSFVLTSGARAKYFANRFTEVKEYVNNMTLRTFAGTDMYKLRSLIEDDDGAVVYYDNTLYPLDRWLRIAPLKRPLYVGNIIAAHC